MSLVLGISLSLALAARLRYFGGIVGALAEIYRATKSPWPLIATGIVAVGTAWVGVLLWRVARSPGEYILALGLMVGGAVLANVGGALWRAIRDAERPDHHPRG